MQAQRIQMGLLQSRGVVSVGRASVLKGVWACTAGQSGSHAKVIGLADAYSGCYLAAGGLELDAFTRAWPGRVSTPAYSSTPPTCTQECHCKPLGAIPWALVAIWNVRERDHGAAGV